MTVEKNEPKFKMNQKVALNSEFNMWEGAVLEPKLTIRLTGTIVGISYNPSDISSVGPFPFYKYMIHVDKTSTSLRRMENEIGEVTGSESVLD